MLSISRSVGRGGSNNRNDVETVQQLINANIGLITPLAPLDVDGKVGNKTIGAITEYQSRVVHMRSPDGVVDPNGKTLRTLNQRANRGPAPANRTAVFESSSKTGKKNQMMSGRITVNNKTYDFRSGGHGRGNLPAGAYTITAPRWDRDDRSMKREAARFPIN